MLSGIIYIEQDQGEVVIICREKRNIKKIVISRQNEQFSVEQYLDMLWKYQTFNCCTK